MTLFEANKNNLIVRYTELFTSGSAKVYYAEFSFSADWDGLAKIATFRNGSVSKSVAVDEKNAFEIPWEVFVNPGTLECGITGTKEDGTTLPTIWATVAPIKQGAEIGDEAKEVTPDIYEQLISRLDEGVTQAQNAAERAEAAAINQPYPNQVTGTWWVWNPEAGEYVDSGISSAAYTLPPMTGTTLGGAMADPAQESDTQPVRIGADHKLYTAPGGSASSPDVLCVNLTMGEGGTITADKTFAEITEAAGSGMCVIARLPSGEILYLAFYTGTSIVFVLNNSAQTLRAYCDSSDTWRVGSYALTASDVGAIPSPSTATVGQTIVVKAVDSNGAPTEWEAADMPSGGGGSGKAKSQILIDQTIIELTASLSVTLEHDFHNLTAIINCGSKGVALTVDSDGNAIASGIGLLINTTDYTWQSYKAARINTTTGLWETKMMGADWSDDLSIFKRGFMVNIGIDQNQTYYLPFGGIYAMYGTTGTDDNAPKTGRTANIVVNNAYLNVGTRVILWGEYYE